MPLETNQENKLVNDNFIFGLDIGTRSIVGVVGIKQHDDDFKVVAYAMEEHLTRAMIDGQIHDIHKVAETIKRVKLSLEKQLGVNLTKVCIAAAGRVLKTELVHVELEIDPQMIIDEGRVNSLELLGMERAHQKINSELGKTDFGFHCVGYTVTKYYLNDYVITSLLDHTGKKMGADVLATFLPQEVVDSLYAVVTHAGLEVYSLTLEPIAAISVAIAESYRLLNIALVDIGAGTSDIAITKEGSVIAFGMIPVAGDELTEAIVHRYLVDFQTAEKIKIASSSKRKSVQFKDIIGMKHKIELLDIHNTLESTVQDLAYQISQKIKSLNGDKTTNAVFLVGGGGQLHGFTDVLAENLGLPKERVAIRGKEVLNTMDFSSVTVKLGPELVTPIGICLTGLANNRQDFIQVFLNDEPVKLYDNNHLTVMDVAAFKGYDPTKLLVKNGKTLRYTLNGAQKSLRGEMGTPARILINHQEVNLSHSIKMNDYIAIIPAKKGKDASMTLHELVESIQAFVTVNDNRIVLKPKFTINGQFFNGSYNIKNEDEIVTLWPTLETFLSDEQFIRDAKEIYVNDNRVTLNYLVQPNDTIRLVSHIDTAAPTNSENKALTENEIVVSVNGKAIKLQGKAEFIFVDIFDYIDFDLSKPQGIIQCLINHKKTSYMEKIVDGDILEVSWQA